MWRIFSKVAGIVAYVSLQAVVNPIYPHSPKQAQVTGMHSIAAPQGINASPTGLARSGCNPLPLSLRRKNQHWSSASKLISSVQFSSDQSHSRVQLFSTPWIAAHQASLSIKNSRSLLKLTSIKSVMSSSHLILCCPLPPCPRSFPASGTFPMSQNFAWGSQSIGVSASASVFPMNTQDRSSLGWTCWISLQSKGLSRVFSNTTVWKHQFFSAQPSSQSNSHIHIWPLEKP